MIFAVLIALTLGKVTVSLFYHKRNFKTRAYHTVTFEKVLRLMVATSKQA